MGKKPLTLKKIDELKLKYILFVYVVIFILSLSYVIYHASINDTDYDRDVVSFGWCWISLIILSIVFLVAFYLYTVDKLKSIPLTSIYLFFSLLFMVFLIISIIRSIETKEIGTRRSELPHTVARGFFITISVLTGLELLFVFLPLIFPEIETSLFLPLIFPETEKLSTKKKKKR